MGYILRFALPIMGGNVLQQMYNTLDSVIVGRYVGEHGLAAVGVASPIMSLLVFFLFGVGLGMTVLLAQRYGNGDLEEFRRNAATALTGGCLFCVPLTLLCVLLAQPVLLLLRTPPEILGQAVLYLRIVFCGLIFTFLYNYHSAALMAIGDSKTPFYALAISSVLNVVLDVLFVGPMGMGVGGAALATVIAQGTSSVLCLIYVYLRRPELSFHLRELRVERRCLRDLVSFSSASALQQTVLYGGRLLIQGAVNPLDVSVIAGYTAACRIESMILVPMEGVASASASFCAKHVGAGDKAGVRDGFFSGLKLSAAYNVTVSAAVWLLAPQIMGLFRLDSPVAEATGVTYLRYIVVFYLLASCTQMLQALFRSLGRLKITIQNSVLQISLRVLTSYLLIGVLGIRAVCLGTFIGWVAMALYSGRLAVRYFRAPESAAAGERREL